MATVERTVAPVRKLERAKRWAVMGRIVAVVIPIVLWFAPLPIARPAQRAIAIGSCLIIGWITEALDPALIGLMGCFLYWSLGVVSFQTAFSGFVDTTTWFLFGAILFGTMASKSGLARRLALAIIEESGNTGERAAGAHAADKAVHLAAHLFPHFNGCGVVVVARIGLIVKLQRSERPGDCLAGFARSPDRAAHSFVLWRAHHLGSEAAHENALLFREALGHKQLYPVAPIDADQCEANAGIARGGLKNCAAGFEQPALFRIQNHTQRGAVLHAAAGIEKLKLGKYCGRWLRCQSR